MNQRDHAFVCDATVVFGDRLFALQHEHRLRVRTCMIDRGLRDLQDQIDAAREDHDVGLGGEQIIEVRDLDSGTVTRAGAPPVPFLDAAWREPRVLEGAPGRVDDDAPAKCRDREVVEVASNLARIASAGWCVHR